MLASRHKSPVSLIEELGEEQTILVTGGASVSSDDQVISINEQNLYSPPKVRKNPNR